MRPFAFNIHGELRQYDTPAVMGVINFTPDSFHTASRATDPSAITDKVLQMVEDGASFIDVGAYSSRPGCADLSVKEELKRLEVGMNALRSVAPDIPVSVDTFRSEVAREAVKNLSVDIINDISGGSLDADMMATVAELRVPYILMHMRGTPQDMQEFTDYDDLLADILSDLANKVDQLDLIGVNDIIIDPGFGFSKTLEQNYSILKNLHIFDVFHLPILVGISRKSMITQLLNISSDEALQATTALNVCALQRGASILRVHDVLPAVQATKLFMQL